MKCISQNSIWFLFVLFTGIIIMTSCEKNPHSDNEEELITTIRYELTPSDGGEKVVFSFSDPDGDGGIQPNITSIGTIKSGKNYNGVLTLLNESVVPSENIGDEIESESKDHQFFFRYTPVNGGNLQFTYNDKDSNNLPLGLRTLVSAGAKGNGKLTITLRHLPDKKASGVSAGNIANAGGETDIEVTFDVTIE